MHILLLLSLIVYLVRGNFPDLVELSDDRQSLTLNFQKVKTIKSKTLRSSKSFSPGSNELINESSKLEFKKIEEEKCGINPVITTFYGNFLNGTIRSSTIPHHCQTFESSDIPGLLTMDESGTSLTGIIGFEHLTISPEETIIQNLNAAETNDVAPFCGVKDKNHANRLLNDATYGNRFLDVSQWENCYDSEDTTHTLSIGGAIGSKLFSRLKNDEKEALNYMESLINQANIIYSKQLNIYLKLGSVWLPTEDPRPFDTIDCDTPIRTQFTAFSRSEKPANMAIWHLFDDCYHANKETDSTAGLAGVGGVCAGNGATSISYLVNEGRSFLTFAHEIGHNFGALHSFDNGVGTTGGIMDYGNGLYQGEYQFNTPLRKSEVCKVIRENVDTRSCPHFAELPSPVRRGCECDPENECCGSGCMFLETNDGNLCTLELGKRGYCSNGRCLDNFCSTLVNGGFCSVRADSPCVQTCSDSDASECMRQNIYDENSDIRNKVIDGSKCRMNATQLGVCKNAECVESNEFSERLPVEGEYVAMVTYIGLLFGFLSVFSAMLLVIFLQRNKVIFKPSTSYEDNERAIPPKPSLEVVVKNVGIPMSEKERRKKIREKSKIKNSFYYDEEPGTKLQLQSSPADMRIKNYVNSSIRQKKINKYLSLRKKYSEESSEVSVEVLQSPASFRLAVQNEVNRRSKKKGSTKK